MSDWKQELKDEQKDMTKEEVMEQLKRRSEWLADMDNLPKQGHNWIDRGLIMSCEGAGHPYHQASKRK